MNATPQDQTPVLYISYDGMLEPLGQSQVLGYVERLAGRRRMYLMSFEKPADLADAPRMQAMRSRLIAAGIDWLPLTYHKRPSAAATAWDIVAGTARGLRLIRRHGIGIVHARSYVPAVMALALKRMTGVRFIFDMRGFWADERVDGGIWPPGSRLYRTAKAMERRFLLGADHVVTLTHASAREIASFDYLQGRLPPITVIPTCADLDRFRPQPVDPARPFTFGYVGSVGTWYLFDETLAFFNVLRRHKPDARLLVVNRSEHAAIRAAVARAGIEPERLELVAAEHHEVASHVARMHVAGALAKSCYSKIASAPTKLAEYLGCGVPCVGNTGVGDMAEILEGERVGVALTDLSPRYMEATADRLLSLLAEPDLAERCTAVARRMFSLDDGVAGYEDIYLGLVASKPQAGTVA